MSQNPRPELIEAVTSFMRQANELNVVVMVLAVNPDGDEMPITASNAADSESVEARVRYLREWADFLQEKSDEGKVVPLNPPRIN